MKGSVEPPGRTARVEPSVTRNSIAPIERALFVAVSSGPCSSIVAELSQHPSRTRSAFAAPTVTGLPLSWIRASVVLEVNEASRKRRRSAKVSDVLIAVSVIGLLVAESSGPARLMETPQQLVVIKSPPPAVRELLSKEIKALPEVLDIVAPECRKIASELRETLLLLAENSGPARVIVVPQQLSNIKLPPVRVLVLREIKGLGVVLVSLPLFNSTRAPVRLNVVLVTSSNGPARSILPKAVIAAIGDVSPGGLMTELLVSENNPEVVVLVSVPSTSISTPKLLCPALIITPAADSNGPARVSVPSTSTAVHLLEHEDVKSDPLVKLISGDVAMLETVPVALRMVSTVIGLFIAFSSGRPL